MPFDIRWLWHSDGSQRGWWQFRMATQDPLRWQFGMLVEFEEQQEEERA